MRVTTYDEMRVKFIIYGGDVIALFPNVPWNKNDSLIMSYARVGLHGSACKSLMRYKRATPEQYWSLLQELRKIYETGSEIIVLKVV